MASARLFQVTSCSSVVASTNLDVVRTASSSSSSSRFKSGWQLGCQSLRTALPSARSFAPGCRRSQNVFCQAVSTSPETETEVETDAGSSTAALEVTASDGDEPSAQAKKPTKHLKNLMETLQRQAIEAALTGRTLPDIRPGDVVQLRLEVPENKRRISLLRGIVIAKHNSGINTTFRIRRMIAGVGVEIVFPLYSPNIKEVKVLDHRKVRRAKLYYLRDKIARLSTC